MTISGYAWGHIVASGPRQLGRDTRVVDTHPQPVSTQKHVTVKLRHRQQRQWNSSVSLVAPLAGRQFHPFHLKQLPAFPKTQGNGRYLPGDRQLG